MENTEGLPIRPANSQAEDKYSQGESYRMNGATPSTIVQALQPQVSQTRENSARDKIWDWTEALPNVDHVRFMKSVNWAATSLGPMQNWPPVLRQATYQVIADSRPATLYWYADETRIKIWPFSNK
jgi:hypothetical protein